MTTSVLNTHVRDSLCEHDLAVIRDFALEAPWEWRIALEELVDIATANDKVENERDAALKRAEEAQDSYAELQKSVKAATDKVLQYVVKLETGRRNSNLTKGDIDTIAEGIRQGFESLVDSAE